jgi:hypothetical protein
MPESSDSFGHSHSILGDGRDRLYADRKEKTEDARNPAVPIVIYQLQRSEAVLILLD